MGVGSFKIPLADYYEKSSELKNKVTNLKDDVQTNFLDLVSANINLLDSRDVTSVEDISAYVNAKSEIGKIETYETQLQKMSQEGDSNPLGSVVSIDNEYSATFSDISQGKTSTEVSIALNSVESSVKSTKLVMEIESLGKDFSDQDWVQRILQLAKLNPDKALEKMLASDEFLAKLSENEKIESFFFTAMNYIDDAAKSGSKVSSKLVNAFADSKLFDYAAYLPSKTQEKLLNGLAKFSDDGFSLFNKTSKVTNFLTNLAQGKVGSIIKSATNSKAGELLKTATTKFGQSKVGKVIANPWTAFVAEAGINSVFAFNDSSDSQTYHNVGKSVASGTIDAIANVGPVSGALMGAAVGGPIGAVIGAGVGGLIWAGQLIAPDAKKNIKNFTYDFIDDPVETTKNVGKAISNTANNVISSIGGNISNMINSTTSSLGWFG